MDLPFLHKMLLLKLPSVDLENALFTSMVIHTSLLLVKELTSHLEKYSDGPRLLEYTGLTVLPTHHEVADWIE